jgi:predicted ABC-class ATPase
MPGSVVAPRDNSSQILNLADKINELERRMDKSSKTAKKIITPDQLEEGLSNLADDLEEEVKKIKKEMTDKCNVMIA